VRIVAFVLGLVVVVGVAASAVVGSGLLVPHASHHRGKRLTFAYLVTTHRMTGFGFGPG
jgi:hypothetical protein